MSKLVACSLLVLVMGLAGLRASALAQSEPDITGTWTGIGLPERRGLELFGHCDHHARIGTVRISRPLCAGTLTRVGSSGSYVFFTEAIEPSGTGHCINGTVTVAPANGNLAWGWFGSFQGKPYVAWALLTKRY